MARPTRLTISKKDIFTLLDGSPQKVYSQAQLAKILEEHRGNWRLAGRTTVAEFIAFLERQGNLKANEFRAPNYDRKTIRYSWGEASIYELAQSLQLRSYLSHGTAVALHGLTDLIPKTLYINVEQSPKPPLQVRLLSEALIKLSQENSGNLT